MIKKILGSGKGARARILAGAKLAGDLVGRTLGPKGRNVIIQTAYHAPKITNDGVTLLRSLVLADETEDLGCQAIVEAAMKTNERAGDGTTTTGVIAAALVEHCAARIEKEDVRKDGQESGLEAGTGVADVVGMSAEILQARDAVVEAIKKSSRPVKKGDIKNIVSTSLGKLYPQFVDVITDMVERAGVDGYISVEDNWGTKYGVESTMSEGLRFLGSYSSPLMTVEKIVNGQLVLNKSKEAVWEDCPVLVTNHRIETSMALYNITKPLRDAGKRKYVVIAEGFEKECTTSFANSLMNAAQGAQNDPMKVLLVKAPALTTDQFHDVAAFVGAKFVDKNAKDGDLKFATIDSMGKARKIVVDEDHTTINGGAGDVTERVKTLKAEIESEKDSSFKEQTKRRLAAMTSGFGIIRVGAATEPERDYLKYKIEDAVNAAKAAMEEGVVKGGGVALKEIADELFRGSIVYDALCAPHRIIRKNAGGDVKVPPSVIDPAKVTRLAVENAFSVAATLITVEVTIANRKRTLIDELQRAVAPTDDDDFRSEGNEQARFLT